MELKVEFQSRQEWLNWHGSHAEKFGLWKNQIAVGVAENGLTEPMTGRTVAAAKVVIDPANLRETISAEQMNSRKRALLVEFDELRRRTPGLQLRSARILAAEALSRPALILRGLYPYFLGTEYIPSEARRKEMYPIVHADLLALDMPDGLFDAVLTGDVLEHVPDLHRAISEMARVLKPGGTLLSTFPFSVYSQETVQHARMIDGAIEHLRPPEYHGDPLDPSGVLVFQIPGWDVLEMCRQAGLADTKMVMHASSTYGIAADTSPGVFVLAARKAPPAALRHKRNWIYEGGSIRSFVGVLGLPRSGTTMFTAVLDAHDEVVSIYEPWNAHKSAFAAGELRITANSLISEAEKQAPHASTLVVKETVLDQAYAHELIAVFREAEPVIPSFVLILLRNPFHCFLSEIEGRKKWWGDTDLELGVEAFERWATRTFASLGTLLRISDDIPDSAFVFYESCVSRPAEVFPKIMSLLGLDFAEKQLQITKHARMDMIRGDQSLVENARDVQQDSVAKRESEMAEIKGRLSRARSFGRISEIADLFRRFEDVALCSGDTALGNFKAAVRTVLRAK